MHPEANGQGPVVDMRQQKRRAADVRKHLEAAGIKREALYSTDDTCKRLSFHDLRGTGLTWDGHPRRRPAEEGTRPSAIFGV